MRTRNPLIQRSQPWIYSAFMDLLLILSPAFLSVFVVLLFRERFTQTTEVPLGVWVFLILGIDVAHVYSTLFRTYFNPLEFRQHKTLFIWVPLLSWFGGVCLYLIQATLFWSLLAYLAVFHFIRQQYGFMMLYSRNENEVFRKLKWVDKVLIYLATLYPIVYWHTHLPRNFHWFIDGDFLSGIPNWLELFTFIFYLICAAIYLGKEIWVYRKTGWISLPKQLIILGTALSWYIGIVTLNGDMTFTITNVISHGLPYLGLIWLYGRKQAMKRSAQKIFSQTLYKYLFSISLIPLFIGVLLILAYVEEGLWHGFIWRERLSFFNMFSRLPWITDHVTLAFVVPLLSVPQITHYILDGFIWRLRNQESTWKKVMFSSENHTL